MHPVSRFDSMNILALWITLGHIIGKPWICWHWWTTLGHIPYNPWICWQCWTTLGHIPDISWTWQYFGTAGQHYVTKLTIHIYYDTSGQHQVTILAISHCKCYMSIIYFSVHILQQLYLCANHSAQSLLRQSTIKTYSIKSRLCKLALDNAIFKPVISTHAPITFKGHATMPNIK